MGDPFGNDQLSMINEQLKIEKIIFI